MAIAAFLIFRQSHFNIKLLSLKEYSPTEKIRTRSSNKYGNYDVFLLFKMAAAAILDLGLPEIFCPV